MIITDSFVFLNYPKTGSTFVREALSELYKKKQKKRWPWSQNKRCFKMYNAPNVRDVSPQRVGTPNPHGTYWQIPERARHLPVYSVFRDPFRRVASLYHYADWMREEALFDDLEVIQEKFPMFPKLDITEFLDYMRFFGHFFLRDADKADRKILGFLNRKELQSAMGNVNFLNNSNLNQELADMLVSHGFNENDVAFIRTRAKSNVSRASQNMTASREEEMITKEIEHDAALIYDLVRAGEKIKVRQQK
jgi:hypothetical protein